MPNLMVTVNFVTRNSEKSIRFFLNSLRRQTHRNFEVNILDNNSEDKTTEIIEKEYPEFKLFKNQNNIGFWAGQEKLINQTYNEIIICMSDVILKEDFLNNALKIMSANYNCGALQARVYQMQLYYKPETDYGTLTSGRIIDTLGFKIFKSRKIINLGHGEEDIGQYDPPAGELLEIFAVEGVVPIFRKTALEDCRIGSFIIDPDFREGSLGYGDDLDLAWRMRLFGWKHLLADSVIAHHDRSTTKGYSKTPLDYLKRVKLRRQIDIKKRRLEWRNIRFTIIKNDYIINIFKDAPLIIAREIAVLGYAMLFEQKVLLEIFNFIKYLPRIIKKRKIILKKAKINATDMRRWLE